MNKLYSSIIVAIVAMFGVAGIVWAFTAPSDPPPGTNVDAPLNVSNLIQEKIGPLILNTGGASNGLIVDQGNVGIGTIIPAQALDVVGQIHASGDICTDVGGTCLSTVSGGGGLWTQSGSDIYYGSGNVGIGTPPDAFPILDIGPDSGLNRVSINKGDGVAGTMLEFNSNGSTVGGIYVHINGDLELRSEPTTGTHDLHLTTNGNEKRLTIDGPTGNVGIGTTDPQSKLQITGGYFQLDVTSGVPPASDCNSSLYEGRMKFDPGSDLLYICSGVSGWIIK